MLLLKVTEITTDHQNDQNSTKSSSFFAQRAKNSMGRSPPQELEEGLSCGPHLLVLHYCAVSSLNGQF